MPELSFFARLSLAFAAFFRILSDAAFASRVKPLSSGAAAAPALPAAAPAPAPVPRPAPASGLFVLGLLQREGRLIDFLEEDVGSFSDAEVGAAARVVHEGCRKVLRQYLALAPVLPEAEGARVSVPAGFDARRIQLTGNVAGQPPFSGALKHHGWVATSVTLPTVSEAMDPTVLAPAEVELT